MLLGGEMLAYTNWRSSAFAMGCQTTHWTPEPRRFAPYIAQKSAVVTLPSQIDDEWSLSSASSSTEQDGESPTQTEDEAVCGWRGCGLRFPSIAKLSIHLTKVHAHPHSDGLFYCGWAGCLRPQRGFNARYKMLVHVRTHTNERPHSCPQCQKSFSRAENLKIHMRSHSGEKPYVCPFEGCGKAYSNSSDRFKHTRTHSVDKPYCCKVPGCNKRYTDPSSLRKHVKTYKHFTKLERNQSPQETFDNHKPCAPENTSATTTLPGNLLSNTSEVQERLSPYKEGSYITIPVTTLYQLPYEISHSSYSNIYDDAYRRHYDIAYKSYAVSENMCKAEDTLMANSEKPLNHVDINDTPLNLSNNIENYEGRLRNTAFKVHPIEESMEFQLVRAMEKPLDLSNKTYT